jgi:hypothetical protein
MNKEIKEKWIQALESDEYKKGTEKLRIGEEFCCLGVLCDIYSKETGLGKWKGDVFNESVTDHKSLSILPVVVKEWAGLKGVNPKIESYDFDVETIAGVNDHLSPSGTFKEVIEIIKEQL